MVLAEFKGITADVEESQAQERHSTYVTQYLAIYYKVPKNNIHQMKKGYNHRYNLC